MLEEDVASGRDRARVQRGAEPVGTSSGVQAHAAEVGTETRLERGTQLVRERGAVHRGSRCAGKTRSREPVLAYDPLRDRVGFPLVRVVSWTQVTVRVALDASEARGQRPGRDLTGPQAAPGGQTVRAARVRHGRCCRSLGPANRQVRRAGGGLGHREPLVKRSGDAHSEMISTLAGFGVTSVPSRPRKSG